MSPLEPKTRHLSRAELAVALSQLKELPPEQGQVEPRTTVWTRPQPATQAREPVTQLEVHVAREGKVRADSREGKVDADRVVLRASASRALITRIGIGVLVACCAWWVGLRAPPPANVSTESAVPSTPASAAQPTQVPPPVAEVPSVPALTAQPPSRRAAVDFLLAGRTQEALDVYRALAIHEPDEASFAVVAGQLERELSRCVEKESGPCVR